MMNMREDYLIHNTHRIRIFGAWLLPISMILPFSSLYQWTTLMQLAVYD